MKLVLFVSLSFIAGNLLGQNGKSQMELQAASEKRIQNVVDQVKDNSKNQHRGERYYSVEIHLAKNHYNRHVLDSVKNTAKDYAVKADEAGCDFIEMNIDTGKRLFRWRQYYFPVTSLLDSLGLRSNEKE